MSPQLDLTDLIRPSAVASFVEQSWGRAPCLYPKSLDGSADDIMNLASFELLLGTLNRAHEGWLQLARGGRAPIPHDMVDAQGMLDLRKTRDAFAAGETLYLTKAERVSPPLMRLARAVQLDLAASHVKLREPVNAHVFLTPPHCQGFPAHRDEHASFVLQLGGSKEWIVYEPRSQCDGFCGVPPMAGGVDGSTLEKLKRYTYRLEKGDVLYMPEWWPHEAKAATEHSLHVTLRLFPLRWVDLMLELCREYPGLAEAIPTSCSWNSETLCAQLLDALNSTAFRKWAPRILDDFLQHQAMSDRVLPDDGLRQVLEINRIDENTPLVLSAGMSCAVFEAGHQLCLRFPGGAIRGPDAFRPVFDFVAAAAELRAADLPAIEGLSYNRLDLVRRVVKDGLFRIA